MDTFFKILIYEKIAASLVRFIKWLKTYKPVELSNPPFFILGSGRNGSTLLSAILNSHQSVFIPPEQFVLPFSIM